MSDAKPYDAEQLADLRSGHVPRRSNSTEMTERLLVNLASSEQQLAEAQTIRDELIAEIYGVTEGVTGHTATEAIEEARGIRKQLAEAREEVGRLREALRELWDRGYLQCVNGLQDCPTCVTCRARAALARSEK